MNRCLQKKYFSQSKNWISRIKFAEARQKNALRTSYCNIYAYAANNPILYTDPDGRKILVEGDDTNTYVWDDNMNDFYNKKTGKYGTNDSFVNSVKESLIYLKKGSSYAYSIISNVSKSKDSALIKKSNYNTGFSIQGLLRKKFYIRFNNSTGLSMNDGTESYESPAMGLFHEICHAYSHLVEHKLTRRIKNKSIDLKWENEEEFNAV